MIGKEQVWINVPPNTEPELVSRAGGTGVKFDQNKLPLDLLPAEPLRQIARVLQYGATKYNAHNWRGGMLWSRPAAAALRHLWAWLDREDLDPETGISHLAHAACNLLFLLQYEKEYPEADDRYKKEAK